MKLQQTDWEKKSVRAILVDFTNLTQSEQFELLLFLFRFSTDNLPSDKNLHIYLKEGRLIDD